jgi:hypothetical protein
MTKSGGKRLNCQITVRVDGVFESFSLPKPKGLTDLQALSGLVKQTKEAVNLWAGAEKQAK